MTNTRPGRTATNHCKKAINMQNEIAQKRRHTISACLPACHQPPATSTIAVVVVSVAAAIFRLYLSVLRCSCKCFAVAFTHYTQTHHQGNACISARAMKANEKKEKKKIKLYFEIEPYLPLDDKDANDNVSDKPVILCAMSRTWK